HAVADRHLRHMHPADDPPHDIDWTGRTRHDAGPQRVEAVIGERGMFELGDEHRRYAVKGSAALGLHGSQTRFRVERLVRQHKSASMCERREITQDTAEAMIEGYRNADAIVWRIPDAFADKESVIQDVVVRERGAFREAGCA